MGYNHSITIPGISSNNVCKRVVKILDGDKEVLAELGKTDNMISYTATNSDISYTYADYDDNGVIIGGNTPSQPEIAPEAPTDVLPPVPTGLIEGDSVLVPASDIEETPQD
jgi:hypothetical protein